MDKIFSVSIDKNNLDIIADKCDRIVKSCTNKDQASVAHKYCNMVYNAIKKDFGDDPVLSRICDSMCNLIDETSSGILGIGIKIL